MRHIFLLLKESAANEEKLTHLEHAEDHPINAGVDGYKHAINTLTAVHKTLTGQKGGAALMTKYDGSPSIVFGHHPKTGKFFVHLSQLLTRIQRSTTLKKTLKTITGMLLVLCLN